MSDGGTSSSAGRRSASAGGCCGSCATRPSAAMLLLVAAAIALVWANSPWGASYENLVDCQGRTGVAAPRPAARRVGRRRPAGRVLLRRRPRAEARAGPRLAVEGPRGRRPAAAALGGMVVPARHLHRRQRARWPADPLTGWGIPMATDIAFALAVLAVVGRRLPVALRAFLLTLAVVDDLGAITVIAVFYSDQFSLAWFVAALATFAAYALAQRMRDHDRRSCTCRSSSPAGTSPTRAESTPPSPAWSSGSSPASAPIPARRSHPPTGCRT